MRFLVFFFFILLAETQDGKTIEQKRKGYDDEKKKYSKVSEFSISHYTQNRKLGNLAEFFFTSIFGKIKNQKMT